jgi:hypothetical protein
MEKMDAIKEWYLGLTNPEKQFFLATVGANLIIGCRGATTKTAPGMNELHHRLFQEIAAVAIELGAYAAHWDYIVSEAWAYNLTKDLEAAMDAARDSMLVVSFLP